MRIYIDIHTNSHEYAYIYRDNIYIYVHVLKPTTVLNLLKRGVAEAIQLPSLQNGDMAEVSVEIPMIFQ